MDERPEELRRQRELIAAHLRWLDELIAKTAPGANHPEPVAAPSPLAETEPTAGPDSAASAGDPVDSEAEALAAYAMPEVDPTSIRNEVKRGCIIYVVIASVLMLSSLAVAWWFAAQD